MTKNEALAAILAQSEGRHLGDLCGWSLSGNIPQGEARALAEELGLKDDFDFPKMTPTSAYRRAVIKAVKSGRRDEERYEVVKVEDTAGKVAHSIVRKDVADAMNSDPSISTKDAEFQTEAQICFDKKTHCILSDKPHPVVARTHSFYEVLCVVYEADNIRIAFQRAFEKWSGVRMLDHGGLWWVPSTSANKVRQWKEFMARTRNTSIILPVFDTQETIEGLRKITEESVEGQLKQLMDDLEGLYDKDSVRMSTLQSRVERFDEIRDKAELYERLLGHQLDSLKSRVKKAQRGLVDSLSVINHD